MVGVCDTLCEKEELAVLLKTQAATEVARFLAPSHC